MCAVQCGYLKMYVRQMVISVGILASTVHVQVDYVNALMVESGVGAIQQLQHADRQD